MDSLKKHLEEVIAEFRSLSKTSSKWNLSDLDTSLKIRFVTRARAAIHRIADKSSPYVRQCEEIINHGGDHGFVVRQIFGVIDSLYVDATSGFIDSQRELIHGELFGDFLEMAQHLLNEGYKDASAIIAGSSLEAHLRQLCIKARLDTETTSGGKVVPKKADRLNADLTGADVYSKLDQKNVTAWLDLRNKAAHGYYDQYESAQVGLLISGVLDFITRHPA